MQGRATAYRSETLSLCSLEALRIALCFFLLRHRLFLPPAAAMPEPLHPEIFILLILFYLRDIVNNVLVKLKIYEKIIFVNSTKNANNF